MGRTLSTNRRGEEVRDFVIVVDPPESQFNPQVDLNDTAEKPVYVLSPVSESFDGRMDFSPPFDPTNPLTLVLGMGEAFRTLPVRNDDPEGYALGPRRDRFGGRKTEPFRERYREDY